MRNDDKGCAARISPHRTNLQFAPGVTRMYGPAARRKRFSSICRLAVLHQCIRPLIGAARAPGHHGYQRACDLISGQASNGPFGSAVFACAGKTYSPSRFILSQTSAGNGLWATSLRAPCLCSSFVRAVRRFLRPGLRLSRGPAHRGRQGWPSRLARLWRRRFHAMSAVHTQADRHAISLVLTHSKLRSLLRTAQAMRPACWRARSLARCGVAAAWPLRSKV